MAGGPAQVVVVGLSNLRASRLPLGCDVANLWNATRNRPENRLIANEL
jgi:hypothetical protein